MSSSDLFNRTPLKVLRARSIALLGERLNSKSLLFTEKDSNGGTHLLRDYRGLAEWAQIDPLVIKGRIENAPDHFQQVLASWCQNPEVTVGHLLDGLAALDRFDVVDDVFELLLEDCRNAVAKGFTTQTIIGENCLTIQDVEATAVGQPLPKYHAMVIYSKGEDNQEDYAFGWHVIQRMEAAGLKVFVPERDLIAGTLQNTVSCEIISGRCKKVVAIFTPSLLADKSLKFLLDMAQHTGIQNKQNVLIPVMYKRCKLPLNIDSLSKIPYEPGGYVNFYQKLLSTLGSTKLSEELKTYPEEFKINHLKPRQDAASKVTPSNSPASKASASITTVSRVSAADEEFDDLNTMMTTVDFADGMETTVTRVSSSLHSQSSLIRGAPSPPTHNPGSSSDAKQIQKQGKSIKTKIKEKLFSRKKYEQSS